MKISPLPIALGACVLFACAGDASSSSGTFSKDPLVTVTSDSGKGSVFTVRLPAVVDDRPVEPVVDLTPAEGPDGDGSPPLVHDGDPTGHGAGARALARGGVCVAGYGRGTVLLRPSS